MNKTSEKITLKADKRTVFRKKLKKVRKEGKIPANVYGEDIESVAITLDSKEFLKSFKTAGETTVLYITIDGKEIPTLVHHIQKHPVSGVVLHADLRKVNLAKKIEANVPVEIVGGSEAVDKKGGVLLTLSETLTVEALPDKLPHKVEIDISGLIEINMEITVADLKKNPDFELMDPEEKVVVRVTEHKEEELAPQIEVETPETEGDQTDTTEETPAEPAEESNDNS